MHLYGNGIQYVHHISCDVRIASHFNKNAYMHEQTTIEFGVRIVNRKNLNRCTPFFGVSLCSDNNLDFMKSLLPYIPDNWPLNDTSMTHKCVENILNIAK